MNTDLTWTTVEAALLAMWPLLALLFVAVLAGLHAAYKGTRR